MGTLWMFSVRRCAVTTISSRPPALAVVVASAALACGPNAVAAPAVPSTAKTARRMVSLEFKWISPILVEFSSGGDSIKAAAKPRPAPPLSPTLRDLWRGINALHSEDRSRTRPHLPPGQRNAGSLRNYCIGRTLSAGSACAPKPVSPVQHRCRNGMGASEKDICLVHPIASTCDPSRDESGIDEPGHDRPKVVATQCLASLR